MLLIVYALSEKVALLAEGVDRNNSLPNVLTAIQESPSSRRAWIEISMDTFHRSSRSVALLAEGVDRNHDALTNGYSQPCRPPRGGRG